jgi:hypothetical protein
VTLADDGWLALVDWLHARNGLGPWRANRRGDVVSAFSRPIRVVVR